MKRYEIGILFGGGGALVGAGLVWLILGNLWGVLVMLAGLGAWIFGYSKLMGASGNSPEQGTYHGLNGEGKQQSEVEKMNQPVQGEQDATIWEKMEK
jgi:hypothetical protein